MYGELIDQLIEALRCLPGVGPKSAQRMAFHLLERNQHGGLSLADALNQAINNVGHCSNCRTLTELDTCLICADTRRQQDQLCVVETPADMFAIEQSGSYKGRYFVLMGHLSPIDGIGPSELGIDLLEQQLQQQAIKEIILATNLTVEGEATAYYISDLAQGFDVAVTRIAQGVPQGSDLDSVDGGTLGHAFSSRKPL